MTDIIQKKLHRLYEAFGNVISDDLTKAKPWVIHTSKMSMCGFGFENQEDQPELENAIFLLISNIACLKDHLKAWCKSNRVEFDVEAVVDGDRDVAIVHDLWNIDKHVELNRRPRSGVTPKVTDINQCVSLTVGGPGSSVAMTQDPMTGELRVSSENGGWAGVVIVGTVVDEFGNVIGEISDICEKAIDRWELAMKTAGVPIIQQAANESRSGQ